MCAWRVRLRVHARACACGVAHMYACVVCMWVRMRVGMRARVHANVRACAYMITLLYMRVQCVRTRVSVRMYVRAFGHSCVRVCGRKCVRVWGRNCVRARECTLCVCLDKSNLCPRRSRQEVVPYGFCSEDGRLHCGNRVEKPERTIPVLLDQEKGKQIANNRHILTCIIAAILYCGRQCIALRGDCESTIGHGNPGNFLAMLKIMAEHDPVLKQHMYTPAMKNATYVSPRSQSDIIDVIGRGVIQQALLQEINGATFFTIMSDEVTTFNKEELALVVRFVDNNDNIREEFLGVKRITGGYIASAILDTLHQLGFSVNNLRGQCYDGARNMSGEVAGVQAIIRQHAPLASYLHCTSHSLNLVLTHSCKLIGIRNMIEQANRSLSILQLQSETRSHPEKGNRDGMSRCCQAKTSAEPLQNSLG